MAHWINHLDEGEYECSNCHDSTPKREDHCPSCGATMNDVPKPYDKIDHPAYYASGRQYEPVKVICDWDLNFNLGNTVKYIARAGKKPGNSAVQDLEKARRYLTFEINRLTGRDITE